MDMGRLKNLLGIALLLAGIPVKADVTGTVSNAVNGNPVAEASVVAVEMPDSTIMDATLTDADGLFSLKIISSPNILIHISHPEYEGSNVTAADSITIALTPKSTELEEVSITAGKGKLKALPGRYIYTPGGLALKAGTALEALKFTPLVDIYDDGNVNIFSVGSSEIWINGRKPRESKEKIAAMLSSISPSNIKSVEIIVAPGAMKEGRGGILNIELRSPGDGWLVSAKSDFIYDNDKLTFIPSIYAFFQKGRFHSSALASYSTGGSNAKQHEEYDYKLTGTKIINEKRQKSTGNALNTNLDLSYDLTQNSFIGVGADIFVNKIDSRFLTSTLQTNADGSAEEYQSTSVSKQPFKNPRVIFKAFYSLNMPDNNANLDVDLAYRFQDGYSTNDSDFPTYSRTDLYDLHQNSGFANAKFTKRFASGGTLNAGAELSLEKREVDVNSTMSQLSNDFLAKRGIASLYVDYNQQFSEQFGFSAGLRGSYTGDRINQKTLNEIHNNDYFDILPSLNLSYVFPGGKHSMNLSYSRNLYRPGIYDLNPFIYWENENSGSRGNPYLKSTAYDYVRLMYANDYGISFSASYSRSKGGFRAYLHEDDKTITTRVQGGKQQTASFYLEYNKEFFSIWNLTLEAHTSYDHAKYKNYPDGNLHNWSYSFSIDNRVLVIPRWRLFANVNYSYFGKESRSMVVMPVNHSLSIYFQKTFPFGLNMLLRLENLIQDKSKKYYDSPDYAYRFENMVKFRSRIWLTLSYTFGNYQVKGARSVNVKGTL